MRILVYEPAYERVHAELQAIVPDAEVIRLTRDDRLLLDGREVEVADAQPDVCWAASEVFMDGMSRTLMIASLKSTALRWLQSGAAGFDHPVFTSLADNGVVLTNSDAAAVAIAEFVMAAVFDCFQPLAERRAAQAAKRWERPFFREVHASRWLIVGMGHIGREVALRARAFGAHVTGIRRHISGDEPADRMLTSDRLPDAVGEADVIVLAAASNTGTAHLVDDDLLARLGPDVVLVNIARGSLIDEAALLKSLDRGRPAVAVLDVFETEPLPADSPLWTHPRVRLSGHASGRGSGTRARGDAVFVDNLRRFVAGEPLRLQVDPAVVRESVQGNA